MTVHSLVLAMYLEIVATAKKSVNIICKNISEIVQLCIFGLMTFPERVLKEVDDVLYVGNITSDNGNVRLEAQTKIVGVDGNSLIKGKLIELFTAYGSIGSDTLPLKVDSGEGAG